METVERPIWRAFEGGKVEDAAAHARSGGMAVVRDRRRWYVLGDAGPPGSDLPLLVDWAIRAIEAPRWWELTEGPARGCVKAMIAEDWQERVEEWIDRDRRFDGATAIATFDCRRCAACCFDNRVELDDEDMERLRARGDRSVMRNVRRAGGKRLLPLVGRDRRCVHLGRSLSCGIYEHRPFMCREFPAGSEQCLTSREEIYDEPFPRGR